MKVTLSFDRAEVLIWSPYSMNKEIISIAIPVDEVEELVSDLSDCLVKYQKFQEIFRTSGDE